MIYLYSLPHKAFARRMNSGGGEYSICLICFAKVDSTPNERELEAAEYSHDCRQRKRAILDRISSRAKQA